MITEKQYVTLSLELHLFFARIMKEHSLFLEAGFSQANLEMGKIADQYKYHFEEALQKALQLSNNVISPEVAASGELFTNYTLMSEQKTQKFTKIQINQEITRLELQLHGNHNPNINANLVQQVRQLNDRVRPLLDGLIDFKTKVLNEVLSCGIFTSNYPLLIEHIIREAKLYKSHLYNLERGQNPDNNLKETELFWDQIMLEHAQFIRSLLDPTEDDLMNAANDFINDYEYLLHEAKTATDMTISSLTRKTLQKTMKYNDFKAAGTKGILECKIRSIILPLLADHVLRESNHYIRLLKKQN